jgi:hypothetical protein
VKFCHKRTFLQSFLFSPTAECTYARLHCNPKWEKLPAGFTAPIPDSEIRPDKTAARIYDKLIEKNADCEGEALQ